MPREESRGNSWFKKKTKKNVDSDSDISNSDNFDREASKPQLQIPDIELGIMYI